MKLNITNILEEDWKVLIKFHQWSEGLYQDNLVVYRAWTDVLSLCKQHHIENLSDQIKKWLIWNLGKEKGEGKFFYANKHLEVDQNFLHYLQNYELEGNSYWHKMISKKYRANNINWVMHLCYGIKNFRYWKSNELILSYYIVSYQIELVNLEDIMVIWNQYLVIRMQILLDLSELLSQSWFWHWALRDCIYKMKNDLNCDHKNFQIKLRQRLLLSDNALVVAKLLLEDDFYENIFTKLLVSSDINRLLATWNLYYPNWMIVYKARSAELTPKEKELWLNFWPIYFKRCLLDAKSSKYIYGQLIRRLLMQSESFIKELIQLLPETMSEYDDFWYQMQRHLIYKKRDRLSLALDEAFNKYHYPKALLMKMKFDKVVLNKVKMTDYVCLLKGCYQTLVKSKIKGYLDCILSLSYQDGSRLSFPEIRDMQIIWLSVYKVVNVPKFTKSYVSELLKCLWLHQYLPIEVAKALQAYMVTVGRYQWTQAWEINEVKSFINLCRVNETFVWQKGLTLIENTVFTLEKRRENDLS